MFNKIYFKKRFFQSNTLIENRQAVQHRLCDFYPMA